MNQGFDGWSFLPNFSRAQMVQLGANVNLTPVSTYIDILSLTLAPGYWLLLASFCALRTDGGCFVEAKLWDGTTVYASMQSSPDTANISGQYAVVATALVGTRPVKLSCATASNVATIFVKAAIGQNAAGNTATTLLAIPIALS